MPKTEEFAKARTEYHESEEEHPTRMELVERLAEKLKNDKGFTPEDSRNFYHEVKEASVNWTTEENNEMNHVVTHVLELRTRHQVNTLLFDEMAGDSAFPRDHEDLSGAVSIYADTLAAHGARAVTEGLETHSPETFQQGVAILDEAGRIVGEALENSTIRGTEHRELHDVGEKLRAAQDISAARGQRLYHEFAFPEGQPDFTDRWDANPQAAKEYIISHADAMTPGDRTRFLEATAEAISYHEGNSHNLTMAHSRLSQAHENLDMRQADYEWELLSFNSRRTSIERDLLNDLKGTLDPDWPNHQLQELRDLHHSGKLETMSSLELVKLAYSHETEADGRLYEPSRDPMIETFGEVVTSHLFSDGYEGDILYVIQDGERYGLLNFGYGSCSGCDALLACESHGDLAELRDSLASNIRWFQGAEALKEDFNNRDWDLTMRGLHPPEDMRQRVENL